jgi:hypothetical protein
VREEDVIPVRKREAERLRVRRVALHRLPRFRYRKVERDGRRTLKVEGGLRLFLVEGYEANHLRRGRLLYCKVKVYVMSFSLTVVLNRYSESVTVQGMTSVPSTINTERERARSRRWSA